MRFAVRLPLQAPSAVAIVRFISSPETVPVMLSFTGFPCHSESTVKDTLSPSILPFNGRSLPSGSRHASGYVGAVGFEREDGVLPALDLTFPFTGNIHGEEEGCRQ